LKITKVSERHEALPRAFSRPLTSQQATLTVFTLRLGYLRLGLQPVVKVVPILFPTLTTPANQEKACYQLGWCEQWGML
jgi:hypothetical protein